SERWVTRTGCRTAIVVVHTMVSCHRLLDVVDYVETDPRVQTVFTVAPDTFNHVVSNHLTELGALVMPWEQATRQQFDLAVAAAVAGDPCLDRLIASLPERQRYRSALDISDDQELVVVSSTWGRDGIFGSTPDLLPRIMEQLATSHFRVGALLHPAVWSAHG